MRAKPMSPAKEAVEENHLVVVQRILPSYRLAFFERLDAQVSPQLAVVHGRARDGEGIRDAVSGFSQLVETVDLPGGTYWQRGVKRRVARLGPSAVVVEGNPRLLSNLALLLWCRWHGVPSAIWGLGQIDRHRRPFACCIGTALVILQVRLAGAAIAYGHEAAHQYKRWGRPDQLVGVAANARTELPEKEAYGARQLPTRVLFVGRLVGQKRIDVLLRSVALCGELPIMVDVVGDGPDKEALQVVSQQLGLTNVTFHGHVEGRALERHFQRADLLALPGRGGLAVKEALAYGIPVVAGPVAVAGDGSLLSTVVHGKTGFVASDASAESFADVLREATCHNDFPALRRQARAKAEELGGLKGMVDGFVRVLDEMCSGATSYASDGGNHPG